jgi:putative ATP-dependent endonuclease of OLD family
LEIADKINIEVAIITDNDGDYNHNILEKYDSYIGKNNIKICFDKRNDLNTLEPQFFDANESDLSKLCEIIDIDYSKYDNKEKIIKYMIDNKTKWALKVFESKTPVNYPDYINEAVGWCNEQ